MRYFLTYLLLGLSISLSAQERIDTLYYDRSGRMAASPQLADYYRVVLFPADSLHSGTFKDFYPTGELRRSGQFLSIDSLDDSNSRFDREVVSFFRNGRVAEQTCYTEGRREGACRQYDDEGHLRIESFYLGGRLTGLQHTYDGQGNCRTVEYDAGLRSTTITCSRTLRDARSSYTLPTIRPSGTLRLRPPVWSITVTASHGKSTMPTA